MSIEIMTLTYTLLNLNKSSHVNGLKVVIFNYFIEFFKKNYYNTTATKNTTTTRQM